GSCVTFGSYLKASAPGQIDYRRLQEIINQD
ncbi:MAG TPA: 3-dehydroquinate dehydratase, partial [Lachnospiraceae bacterium]|nr:3-dehydroquinate dehydratase [Lachnospiraceae bacterium]